MATGSARAPHQAACWANRVQTILISDSDPKFAPPRRYQDRGAESGDKAIARSLTPHQQHVGQTEFRRSDLCSIQIRASPRCIKTVEQVATRTIARLSSRPTTAAWIGNRVQNEYQDSGAESGDKVLSRSRPSSSKLGHSSKNNSDINSSAAAAADSSDKQKPISVAPGGNRSQSTGRSISIEKEEESGLEQKRGLSEKKADKAVAAVDAAAALENKWSTIANPDGHSRTSSTTSNTGAPIIKKDVDGVTKSSGSEPKMARFKESMILRDEDSQKALNPGNGSGAELPEQVKSDEGVTADGGGTDGGANKEDGAERDASSSKDPIDKPTDKNKIRELQKVAYELTKRSSKVVERVFALDRQLNGRLDIHDKLLAKLSRQVDEVDRKLAIELGYA
eukprot:gene20890-27743_t